MTLQNGSNPAQNKPPLPINQVEAHCAEQIPSLKPVAPQSEAYIRRMRAKRERTGR